MMTLLEDLLEDVPATVLALAICITRPYACNPSIQEWLKHSSLDKLLPHKHISVAHKHIPAKSFEIGSRCS